MIRVVGWASKWLSSVFLASSLACSGATLYTMTSTGGLVWEGADINASGEVVGAFNSGIYFNGQYANIVGPLGGSGHYSYARLNAINNNKLMVGESTTGVVNHNTGPR